MTACRRWASSFVRPELRAKSLAAPRELPQLGRLGRGQGGGGRAGPAAEGRVLAGVPGVRGELGVRHGPVLVPGDAVRSQPRLDCVAGRLAQDVHDLVAALGQGFVHEQLLAVDLLGPGLELVDDLVATGGLDRVEAAVLLDVVLAQLVDEFLEELRHLLGHRVLAVPVLAAELEVLGDLLLVGVAAAAVGLAVDVVAVHVLVEGARVRLGPAALVLLPVRPGVLRRGVGVLLRVGHDLVQHLVAGEFEAGERLAGVVVGVGAPGVPQGAPLVLPAGLEARQASEAGCLVGCLVLAGAALGSGLGLLDVAQERQAAGENPDAQREDGRAAEPAGEPWYGGGQGDGPMVRGPRVHGAGVRVRSRPPWK